MFNKAAPLLKFLDSLLNPLRLAARDVRSAFSSLLSIAVMLGLLFVPGFYAWFNIGGEFNLYSRTKDLQIDVINLDSGFSSPLLPLGVNFGNQVVKSLQSEGEFLWVETGKAEAMRQVEDGKAYAAVEIPKGFSKGLMSIFSNPSPIRVEYFVNESITPLSPKLAQEGMDNLEGRIREVFVSDALKIALSSLEILNSAHPASAAAQLSSQAMQSSEALKLQGSALSSYALALSSVSAILSSLKSQLPPLPSAELLPQISLKPLSLEKPDFEGLQKGFSRLKGSLGLLAPADRKKLLSLSEKAEKLQKLAAAAKTEAERLAAKASGTEAKIRAGWQAALKSASDLSRGLKAALASTSSASASIRSLSQDLEGLSSLALGASKNLASLSEALSKGPGLESLSAVFQNPGKSAELLTSPVKIKEEAVYPVSPFGSSIMPFYAALAMWIGCLLDCLIIKMKYSPAKAGGLERLRRWHLVVGRWAAIEAVAFAQCEIVALGCMFYLGSQVKRPWLFLLLALFCSLSFSSLAYGLVRTFGEAGKMLCELILILQITASGGIYPLQMLPRFAAGAAKLLPATYAIGSIRSCVGGSAGYWKGASFLALFFAASWCVSLLIGRLCARAASSFSEILESGGLAA